MALMHLCSFFDAADQCTYEYSIIIRAMTALRVFIWRAADAYMKKPPSFLLRGMIGNYGIAGVASMLSSFAEPIVIATR